MAGYETTPFGDGVSTTRVQTVKNNFGPRTVGGGAGVLRVNGITEQLVIDFTGKDYNDGLAPGLVAYVIPAGSVIKAAYIDVEEAFALTGTDTLAVEVGTDGSEATNGFTITEAQIEATASVNLTSALSGTWDAEATLAADTTVGIALSGTNPVLSDAGKARITIIYDRVNLSL